MRKKDFDRTSELVEKNVPLTSETESCYIHMLGNANEMVRKLAFQWFLAKADEGVSSAESVVALCYRSGIGTVRNDSRFVLWIQRAVRDGDSNAQTYLGSYLLEGIENVLPQDVTHGIQLLEQAVLQENADAMLILGRWLVEQNGGRPEQQQRGFALLQRRRAPEIRMRFVRWAAVCFTAWEHRQIKSWGWKNCGRRRKPASRWRRRCWEPF
ncbi:MAG: tetratricopeptide repeat protein [Ruminococcus sp.]